MVASKIKIIIADDHPLYRDGLKMLLSRENDLEIIDGVDNGISLIEKVRSHKPDVAIVDLNLPEMSGIEAIQRIGRIGTTKCLAHSTYCTHDHIVEALEAGAQGYIVKNALRGEITDGIRSIALGEPYYCETSASVISRVVSRKLLPRHKDSSGLSQKEISVLYLIAQDKCNKEIASELYLSPRTIEGIRSNLLHKLGAKTAIGLVVYALKNKLFDIDDLDCIV